MHQLPDHPSLGIGLRCSRFSRDRRTRHSNEWEAWVASIRSAIARPNHLTIFPCGSKSNWNREDDQQPAAGIAITYINNGEVSHTARALGFTATNFDADLCALVSAAHQAQLFLNQRPVPQVTIFPINPFAIHPVTNLSLIFFSPIC
jgi:hypothetical protein